MFDVIPVAAENKYVFREKKLARNYVKHTENNKELAVRHGGDL